MKNICIAFFLKFNPRNRIDDKPASVRYWFGAEQQQAINQWQPGLVTHIYGSAGANPFWLMAHGRLVKTLATTVGGEGCL